MKLEKAIEELTEYVAGYYCGEDTPVEKAVELGIEALKRVKYCRERTDIYPNEKLPGETEEVN